MLQTVAVLFEVRNQIIDDVLLLVRDERNVAMSNFEHPLCIGNMLDEPLTVCERYHEI